MNAGRPIIPKAANPALSRGFLRTAEADELLAWCLREVSWRSEALKLFGREVRVPRQVAWFAPIGVNYRYSGRDHPGHGVPAALQDLLSRIARTTGVPVNHVLLNRYANGSDYMGWHRDDEAEVSGGVHVLSLGAQRRLRWRREDRGASLPIDLPHGSLLSMDGRLPHTLVRSKALTELRVSLSFRAIST